MSRVVRAVTRPVSSAVSSAGSAASSAVRSVTRPVRSVTRPVRSAASSVASAASSAASSVASPVRRATRSARSSNTVRTAVSIAAPIVIGMAAPAIGGAVASSFNVTSILGRTAIQAGTGALLGGSTSSALGGDFRTGAILGGVSGGVGGFARANPSAGFARQAAVRGGADAATARVFGADTSDSLQAGFAGATGSAAMSGIDAGTRMAFNAARDSFGATPVQGGLDLSTGTTLPTTQGVGVPTTGPATATGSQSLLAAGAGTPTIGAGSAVDTPALDLRQAMSPQQAVASRAIGQAPSNAMMASTGGSGGVLPVNIPDFSNADVVLNRDARSGMTLQTGTPLNELRGPVTAADINPEQIAINQQATPRPFDTIGNSGRPIQLSTTQVSPDFAGATGSAATGSDIPTVGTQAEPDRNFVGRLWDRFTDGERWADFAIMAGGQVISSMLMRPDDQEFEFDPGEFEQAMPDFGGFDITEIQGQLSPEEQELYQLMLEDMQRLAEQDQELFLERMNLARGLIGEANYFDPEYWGSRAMAQTRVAAGRAAREAERERALTGRAPSAADRRQREIDAALAGQSAYTEAADSAGSRRLSTMQQAAGLMPSSAPARMDTSGLTGLTQTGFDRMQQDFQNQLSAAQQFDNSRRTAFDIFSREQDRRDQRAAAAQQGLGGLLEPFMSTS